MLEKYNDVVSIDEMCKILKIGRNTAYKLLQSNQIKSLKNNKKYIIPKMSIINFLEKISSQ